MKKLIFLSLMLICAFTVSAQNYSSPGVPSGTTTFTPTFRYKPATPDSLAQIWQSITGNKWFRMSTGMDDIVFSAINFKGAGTTSSKLDLNNSIIISGSATTGQGFLTGDITNTAHQGYFTKSLVGSNGVTGAFSVSSKLGGGASLNSITGSGAVHVISLPNLANPYFSPDSGAHNYPLLAVANFVGMTYDTTTYTLTATGGGNTIYTANDSLTSNRKVTFVTHKLELGDLINVKAYVDIDPTTNAVNIYTYGATSNSTFNIADDAFFLSNSNPASGYSANFQVSGNDDSKAAAITSVSPSGSNRFQMYASGAGVYTDGIGSKGIIYANNYGANFTDRSLVDKGYVDSVATAIGGGGSFINNSDITSSPQNASIWLDNANAMQVGSGSLNSQMSNGNIAQFVSGTGFVSMTHNDLNWQSGASHTYDFHVDSAGNKFTISASSGTHYLFLSEVQSEYQPTNGNDLIRKRDADSLYAPISGSGVISVSGTTNRITSTGGTTPVIDISASYVGQTSITTLGTIATGSIPYSLLTGTPSLASYLTAVGVTTANGVSGTSSGGTTPNLTLTLGNITPTTISTTIKPATVYQTAAGTAGTDSVMVKHSGGIVDAISPTYYAPTASPTFSGTVTVGSLGGYIKGTAGALSAVSTIPYSDITGGPSTLTAGRGILLPSTAIILDTTQNYTWLKVQTIQKNGIQTTSTDGSVLQNATASTSGVTVQQSPRIHFIGHSWNTTATAADNISEWIQEVRPTSSSAPDSYIYWASRQSVSGSGSFTDRMSLRSNGNLFLSGTGASNVSWTAPVVYGNGSGGTGGLAVNGNNYGLIQNTTAGVDAWQIGYGSSPNSLGTAVIKWTPSLITMMQQVNVTNLTASKVVFTDASKNLTSTGIGTSSQYIAGDGSLGTIGAKAHNISTPATGGTVSLTNNQYNIINPAGTLATLTINLPSSPANNDCVYIKYTQAITAVTYGNGTVVDGITAPTAGGLVVLTYDSGTTSWY